VTGVSPGPVKTERWDSLVEQQAKAAGKAVDAYVKEQNSAMPLGRIALPEEVADLVCFLASGRAAFLTGITITVDGGATRGVYL
jgi:3-oxoacyl-[acyl-carrier protein] reductase